VLCVLLCRAPIIRFNERVYIPQDAHPEIGFIGMIIGPRGNSLRKIEKEVICYCGHGMFVIRFIGLIRFVAFAVVLHQQLKLACLVDCFDAASA